MVSAVDVLGVVIGGLHASGKLTDKLVIEQELKKWLPEVTEYDLNCYVTCIWCTARCVMHEHHQDGTKSEILPANAAIPGLPEANNADMLQIKPENTGLEPLLAPLENVASEELPNCKTTLILKRCFVLLEKLPPLTGEMKHRHFGVENDLSANSSFVLNNYLEV
jgi:hypothetical protein